VPSSRGRAPVVLGVVTRPHGLRGAVNVFVYNQHSETLASGREVDVVRDGTVLSRRSIRSAEPSKGTWRIRLEGVDTVEQAEALRGASLCVDRDDLPAAAPDEFYVVDLIGCRVIDSHRTIVGDVTDVIEYPSVDALVVTRAVPVDGAAPTIEIPVVDAIVSRIDLDAREIVVDLAPLTDA